MCYQFRVDGRTVALNRCSKCPQLQRLRTTWTMFADEVRSREKKVHSQHGDKDGECHHHWITTAKI